MDALVEQPVQSASTCRGHDNTDVHWKIAGLKTKEVAVPTGNPRSLPKQEKKTQKKHKNTEKKYRQRHV